MRYLYFFFFLLLPAFLLAQSQWQIPGVQEQPQWAMPFFFEDANGDKDTVWIGYDKKASRYSYGYDSVYNEYRKVDTSRFQVILFAGAYSPVMTIPIDSAYKVAVQNYPYPYINVSFIRGKLPIVMKWIDTLLNSDSLPYKDQSPRPRARIDLKCINGEPPYNYCITEHHQDAPIILTNYPVDEFQTSVYTDSFTFDGSGSILPAKALSINLTIVPHSLPLFSALEDDLENAFVLYPNPADEVVILKTQLPSYGYDLYDRMGGVILSQPLALRPVKELIDVSHLSIGLYVLRFYTSTSSVSKIIYKTR